MERKEEIQISFLIVIIILSLGVAAFIYLEGWNFIDSLYYVSSILTMVGPLDIVPLTVAGRIISIIYMWLGVAVVASSIGFVGATVLKKRLVRYLYKQPSSHK